MTIRFPGYHAYGNSYEIQYHRASLSRLFHGNNGKLIKSQAELDAALDLIQQKAGQICNAIFGNFHFTRVDMVWQFQGDFAADFILAHRTAKHPRIHSSPSFYESRSMAWKGSEMRVNIYDKTLERHKYSGDIVRVEIQLKGRRLQEELGHGARVTKLDFNTCYSAYRRILLGFVPSPITRVSSIAQFLAIGEREGWNSGGVSAFDLYARGLGSRQVRRLQRATWPPVARSVFNIDWSQLLLGEREHHFRLRLEGRRQAQRNPHGMRELNHLR